MSKKISSMGASAPSRSRASINRKQGGGNKLSGLPSNTNKTSLSSNINKNKSWMAPRRKDLIFCVNQLGGIGRHRSQFRGSSADGVKDCIEGTFSNETFTVTPNSFTSSQTAGPIAGSVISQLNLTIDNLSEIIKNPKSYILTELTTTDDYGQFNITSEENEMDVVDIKAEKHDGSLDNTSVSGTTDGIDTKKKKSTCARQSLLIWPAY